MQSALGRIPKALNINHEVSPLLTCGKLIFFVVVSLGSIYHLLHLHQNINFSLIPFLPLWW